MPIELAALRKVALFESLLPEHVKLVAGIVEEKQYPPGTPIFKDGDPADRFFFIVQGKVRKQNDHGPDALIAGMAKAAARHRALLDEHAG